MRKASDYLRLVRIHTSAETQGLLLIGYLAAGGHNLGVALLWLVYGVVSHAWGFLQNNIFDFEADRADPEKKHFPLVSGAISYRQAVGIDSLLLVMQPVLGIFLIGPVSWSPSAFLVHPYAWSFMFFSIFFGTAYNKLSKRSLLGPLYISVAYWNLAFVSYASLTNQVTWGFVFISLYVFFTILWQISYSGYLKDIGSDKTNLLRKLGMSIVTQGEMGVVGVIPSRGTILYGYGMRLPTLLLLSVLVALYSPNALTAVLFLGLAGLTMYFVLKLVELGGVWDHHKTVMQMAVVEILVYFSLVVALEGLIGWTWTVFLVVYPILWYIVLNRLTWGTTLTPRV